MLNSKAILLQKFRLIFIPFFLSALGYIILYTFLHWLLLIKWQLLNVKEDYVDTWGPLILPWIAALTWLGKRIKLLQLKRNKGDSTFGIQMMASLAIAAPVIIAQNYLETASGKLTVLNHVEEITTNPSTKFYEIRSYYIDTASKGVAYTSDVSGKYNESLNLHIYLSSPMYDSVIPSTKIGERVSEHTSQTDEPPLINKKNSGPLFIVDNMIIDSSRLHALSPDSVASVQVLKGVAARSLYGNDGSNGVVIIRTKKAEREFYQKYPFPVIPPPKAWYCIHYSKTISNRLSKDKKEEKFRDFYVSSMDSFHSKNLNAFIYLRRTGFNDNLTGFKKAIRKTHLANDSSIINIMEPEFKSYADRNGHTLPWIFASLGIGSAIFFAFLLGFRFDDQKLNDFHEGKPEFQAEDAKEMAGIFKPRHGYYSTPIILYLNILVFLVMVIAGLGFVSFNSTDLLQWGANFKPSVIEGQWWRLVTSMFLHSGIMHLASNMIGLIFVGILLEPVLGSKRFAIFYILAGLCASLTSIWWYRATVSVGASGAIFGLYGIFTALLLSNVFPKSFSKSFLVTMSIFIGYNLIMGLNGGIDNAAHIGGLITGLIIGYFVAPDLNVIQNTDTEMNPNP
jgi:rhomboid protease GluP